MLKEFKDSYTDEIFQFISPNKKLSEMFKNCFYSTLNTTVIQNENELPFVITGDIPAMWLRDSSAQVFHYLRFCRENPDMDKFICGLIYRQISEIMYDPYANAYNICENNKHWRNDETDMKPGVWERKYEVDSLCYAVRLIYKYICETSRLPVYGGNENAKSVISKLFETILNVWETEQRHFENSPYRFTRHNTSEKDTLHNGEMGNPVNYTGMTWSGFRPSDDACVFGYLIPSEFFAASVLENMKEISAGYLNNSIIESRADKLKSEILHGINNYGIYRHPTFGEIYAYETDGFGNYYVLGDDANSPSLLTLPYLCGNVINNDIYSNTRKFVLSRENPNYVESNGISGIGSIHTPKNFIWHMSLAYRALTSADSGEIKQMLDALLSTDGGALRMHESFNPKNPSEFTRSHFAWADSVFAELIMKIYDNPNLRNILI